MEQGISAENGEDLIFKWYLAGDTNILFSLMKTLNVDKLNIKLI